MAKNKKHPPINLDEIIDGLVQLDDQLLEVLSCYHYHQTAVHEIMTNGLEEDKSRLLHGHWATTYWLSEKAKEVLDEVERLKERAVELEGQVEN